MLKWHTMRVTLAAAFSVQLAWGRVEDGRDRKDCDSSKGREMSIRRIMSPIASLRDTGLKPSNS